MEKDVERYMIDSLSRYPYTPRLIGRVYMPAELSRQHVVTSKSRSALDPYYRGI